MEDVLSLLGAALVFFVAIRILDEMARGEESAPPPVPDVQMHTAVAW